jgi:DNA-binding LacI/PurR family transcriptional regulator
MDENLLNHVPKALRIREEIKGEIQAGRHGKTGDNFLSVRSLAKYADVSLVTAHRIMNKLKDDGYITLAGNRYILSIPENSKSNNLIPFSAIQRKNRIGLIVTNLGNPFFAILAKKVEQVAMSAGFEVMISSSNYDLKKEADILMMFQEAGVAGILSCPGVHPKTYKIYSSLAIPFVFIARKLEKLEADSVLPHQFSGARRMAEYFVNNGFYQFAYIGIKELNHDPRLQGFKAGLSELGYDLPENRHITISNKELNNSETEIDNFVKSLSTPTAIFCFHDLLAVTVIRVCQKSGIPIPLKIAVAGFDNLPVSSQIFPSLTTISYPLQEMSEIAIDRLIKKINTTTPLKNINHYLEPELIVRESTTATAEIKVVNEIRMSDLAYVS